MARSHKSDRDNIKSFDSLEEFHAYCETVPLRYSQHLQEFFRMQRWDSCMRDLQNGNLASVDAAQSLIDKMADENIFSEGATELSTSLAGFMPCVPNAISGQPNDMFTFVPNEDVTLTSPLRIYFETTVPQTISERELTNRGIAILCFALAMSRMRTVEVHALSISASGNAGHAYGVAVRLPTTPIDLARVAWVMTSQGYARNLGFSCVKHLQNDGRSSGLSLAWCHAHNRDRELSIRDTFNLEETDVVIIRESEDQRLMCSNPIQWVKNMLAKHHTI